MDSVAGRAGPTNKNIIPTECYEPGSCIKALAALALLEENAVTPDEIFDCQGKSAMINKVRVENWTPMDKLSFTDVIRRSSNVGLVKAITRIGPKFYEHLVRLGLGKSTGIQFPGERSGFLNPPHRWSRPSLTVMSFGYEMSTTLLQLGRAFSVIANGGHTITPSLVLGQHKDSQVCPGSPVKRGMTPDKQLYSERAIEQTREILSGFGERFPVDGCHVFGKTGTTRRLKNGKYSKYHHTYTACGAVERDGYRRVIVAFLGESPKAPTIATATQVVAPLLQRVAQQMVLYETYLA
jgi:cell division protein FtsI (penicillin-binding protein 3)